MKYSTGDRKLIKEINKYLVFKIIQEHDSVSKPEISHILGLTPATVSTMVNELVAEGLVVEAGIGSSSGGRKPVLVKVNGGSMFFIGVAVHKGFVEAAVINLSGQIIEKVIRYFEEGNRSEDYQNKILEAIELVNKKCGVPKEKIHGIGVGMHGIVDTRKGISIFAPAMLSRNINLKKLIEDKFDLHVYIQNDSRAMAIGEQWFGVARGVESFVYVNVGKGIGSGVIIKGELLDGHGYAAGEIGHFRVVDNGSKCVCGNYGCLDTVASEYSLIRDIVGKVQVGMPTMITDIVQEDISKISVQTILQAADAGDDVVIESLAQIGRYLGRAVSYVINMLNPDMVVIGGSLSVLGEYLLQPVIETASDLCMRECMDDVKIVLSKLKEDAGVVGGAAMVMQNTLKNPQWGKI